MTSLARKVSQLITMSAFGVDEVIASMAVVVQDYPEAMHADEVIELNVRSLDADRLFKVTNFLVNNGLAVQRCSVMSPVTTHLRVWSETTSNCRLQRDIVLQRCVGFEFVDGWQWRSVEDLRGTMFELPRRITAGTWVVGMYYGLEDGGPHGIWNRGTFVVTFGADRPTEVESETVFVRNGTGLHSMQPGKSFSRHEGVAPSVLF